MANRGINTGYDIADDQVNGHTIDPAVCQGNVGPTSGVIFLHKIWLPAAVPVANIVMYVVTAGVTLTAGQNLAGLYDSNGNLLGQTADQAVAWTSAGIKTMAVAGGTVTAGGGSPGSYVWGAVLAVGTTTPKFGAALGSVPLNIGKGFPYVATIGSGANHRVGYTSGSRTSLPASLNGVSLTDLSWANLIYMGLA